MEAKKNSTVRHSRFCCLRVFERFLCALHESNLLRDQHWFLDDYDDKSKTVTRHSIGHGLLNHRYANGKAKELSTWNRFQCHPKSLSATRSCENGMLAPDAWCKTRQSKCDVVLCQIWNAQRFCDGFAWCGKAHWSWLFWLNGSHL